MDAQALGRPRYGETQRLKAFPSDDLARMGRILHRHHLNLNGSPCSRRRRHSVGLGRLPEGRSGHEGGEGSRVTTAACAGPPAALYHALMPPFAGPMAPAAHPPSALPRRTRTVRDREKSLPERAENMRTIAPKLTKHAPNCAQRRPVQHRPTE